LEDEEEEKEVHSTSGREINQKFLPSAELVEEKGYNNGIKVGQRKNCRKTWKGF
jgi:hypothetical protein